MVARIITLLVVLFLLVRLRVRYKRGTISLRRALFWSLPWLGLGVVMLSPGLADRVASMLGLETATGIDLMAYVAVGVAFYALFRVFIRLDRLEQDLTTLSREIAFRNAEGEGSKTPSDY